MSNFWNGSHFIPYQRGMVFTKIIIPQNCKQAPILLIFHFNFIKKQICICINGPDCSGHCLHFSRNRSSFTYIDKAINFFITIQQVLGGIPCFGGRGFGSSFSFGLLAMPSLFCQNGHRKSSFYFEIATPSIF